MGLYIQGIEMPEKQVCVILNPNGLVEVLDANNVLLEEYQAIAVPPHGDLIERDALDVIGYCGIPQGHEDTFDDGVMWLAEQIDFLPTIIPAEEGEI